MKIFLLGRPCLTTIKLHTTIPCTAKNESTACLDLSCALITLVQNFTLPLLQSVDSPAPDCVCFGSHSQLEGLCLFSTPITLQGYIQ